MKNLYKLFLKYHLLLLFLVLQTIALYLLFQNNYYHNTKYINSSSKLAAGVLESRAEALDYFHLKSDNDSLNKIISDLLTYTNLNANSLLIPNDSLTKEVYTFIPAKIISSTTDRTKNYLTINKGASDSIEIGNAVVSGNNAVGIVKMVSTNYAVVIPLIHERSETPIQLFKTKDAGIAVWKEQTHFTEGEIANLAKEVLIDSADVITTSGFDGAYPENVVVGYIKNSAPIPGSNFQKVSFHFAVNFSRLRYVQIVKNNTLKEIETLQNSIDD